jgi:hypothetical protein
VIPDRTLRDRHVAFLASFHSPEVIFEQISVIYSLPKMFVASFTLILPFFPTGTSERVEQEVGTDGQCSPPRQSHFEHMDVELNGIL